MQIVTGPLQVTQRVVIYAPEGWGKSTLASRFPKPLFIDTEGSTDRMDVARAPKPSSWSMLMETVSALAKNNLGYQTLVIDTADWAERLCADELCAKHSQDGIEGFGYGKGYKYLAESFGKLLDALSELRKSGMHVVLLAHAATRKFELPEETGAFDRWEMKLSKHVCPLVKEWADMVLFGSYETYVVEDTKTKTKKAQGGARVLYTTHHVCWDAKNRHDLSEKCDGDYAAIAHCFTTPATGATSAPAPVAKPPAPPAPSAVPSASADTLSPAKAKVRDLCIASGVKSAQIMAFITAKGYFPVGTKFVDLPDDWIESKLIPGWQKLMDKINAGETANVA